MSDAKEWLIYSRHHNMFWRPCQSGYTTNIHEAGRYTEEMAHTLCKIRDPQEDGSPSEIAIPSPDVIVEKYYTLGERDRMWCTALVECLEVDLLQSVLARFNELRERS